MKNILLATLTLLMLVDIGLQSFNLYQRKAQGPVVRAAAPGTTLQLEGYPLQGDPKASSILVEFSDYECPFCIRHNIDVAPQVEEQFITTGKIQYAFVNNPLPIHPHAKLLASAAICSGQQSHFWEMHEALFGKRPRSRPETVALAQGLQIDPGRFEKCLDDPSTAARIEDDIRVAKKLGLLGTPAFALGKIDSQGHVTVERIIAGAAPFQTFELTIDSILPKNATSVVQKSSVSF